MLAVMGERPLAEGAVITAAHVDCPRLDLKQLPLYEDSELAFFKTHYYGGIKKYQWTAIPLELHGTVVAQGRRGHRRRHRPGSGRARLHGQRPAAASRGRADVQEAGRGRQGRGAQPARRLRALRRRGQGPRQARRHERYSTAATASPRPTSSPPSSTPCPPSTCATWASTAAS